MASGALLSGATVIPAIVIHLGGTPAVVGALPVGDHECMARAVAGCQHSGRSGDHDVAISECLHRRPRLLLCGTRAPGVRPRPTPRLTCLFLGELLHFQANRDPLSGRPPVFERILQVAARLLASKPSAVLSVRSLWESVAEESRKAGFEMCELPDFAALLEADARFEFIRIKTLDGDEPEGDLDEADEELINLGFLTESTVCLRRSRRTRTEEDGDEMPSISTRHLSETRSVLPRPSSGKADRSSRGKTGQRGPSKSSGRRRSR